MSEQKRPLPPRMRPFTPDEDYNVVFAVPFFLGFGILAIVGIVKLVAFIVEKLS